MKTLFLLSFLCLANSTLYSQETKIKFGKISPADLAMTVYEPDPEASAVILSKIGRIKYDILQDKYPLTEENHIVIKILKESAIDEFGNVEFNYYDHNGFSQIGNIKAVVHLPDGTDVKVDNTQVFDEKLNDYWSAKRIAFPKLVPGAIIEYQYSKITNGAFQPVDWFFQSSVPIKYAELTTKIPEFFDYVILTQGDPLDKNARELTTESVSVTSFARSSSFVSPSRMQQGSADINFVNYNFINKDVPALKEECCITTMEDYYSRVRYQLRALVHPNTSREPVMNTWKEVADKLFEMPDWGLQFKNNRPGELVLEAAGITPADFANQMQTVKKLYYFINQNIQWDDYYSIGQGRDISAILKTKSGDSGELNKLMHAALLQAGITSKPVLMSTRENGKHFEIYPFLDQFNHMAVLANVDGKDMWLDLGDKNLPPGLLRPEVLNSRGWIADELNPIWIDVKAPDSKSVYYVKGTLDANGNFNGDLEARFTGYHALTQREIAADKKEKYGADMIGSGITTMSISNLEKINEKEIESPFQLKAKLIDYSITTVTPDKVYILPIIPVGLTDIPFKLEERTYPIEMNYAEEISMIMDITLPEGYKVESVPEPVRFITEGNGIVISYNVSQTPGKINVNMKYTGKQLHFDPKEYAALKNIYSQRNQKFNEQIVLSKS